MSEKLLDENLAGRSFDRDGQRQLFSEIFAAGIPAFNENGEGVILPGILVKPEEIDPDPMFD